MQEYFAPTLKHNVYLTSYTGTLQIGVIAAIIRYGPEIAPVWGYCRFDSVSNLSFTSISTQKHGAQCPCRRCNGLLCARYFGLWPEFIWWRGFRITGITGKSCAKTGIGGRFWKIAETSNFRLIRVRNIEIHMYLLWLAYPEQKANVELVD